VRRRQANTIAAINAGNVNKPRIDVKGRKESGKGKWPPPTVNEIGDISQTGINSDGAMSMSVNSHSANVPVRIPPATATGTRSKLIFASDFVPASEPGGFRFANDRPTEGFYDTALNEAGDV